MRISGKALRQVHDAIAPQVVPGASTMDLEKIAVAKIAELGAIAAFKGYHGYPAALCTSVNDEVVHGIPNAKRILNEGDILSIDCGVIIDGFYSDAAVTYPIGKVSPDDHKAARSHPGLARSRPSSSARSAAVSATSPPLSRRSARPRASASSASSSATASAAPCTKTPRSPTSATRGKGPRLKAGMVLAIEPMINAGGPEVRVLKDGWTAVTIDGSYSAHFEHTVAITKDGPQVLNPLGPNFKLAQTVLGYYKRCCVCKCTSRHIRLKPEAPARQKLRKQRGLASHFPKEIVCRRKMQLK